MWRSRWTAAWRPSAPAASRWRSTISERRCRRRSSNSFRQATNRWRPTWTSGFGPSTCWCRTCVRCEGIAPAGSCCANTSFRRPRYLRAARSRLGSGPLPWLYVRRIVSRRLTLVSVGERVITDQEGEADVMPLTAGSHHGASRADSDLFVGLTRELLQRDCNVRFRATGTSMHPTIRDGEVVTVAPSSGDRVALGDVICCAASAGVRRLTAWLRYSRRMTGGRCSTCKATISARLMVRFEQTTSSGGC